MVQKVLIIVGCGLALLAVAGARLFGLSGLVEVGLGTLCIGLAALL